MSCLPLNLTCFNGGSCFNNSCYCLNNCFYGNQCESYFNILELPMTSAMLQDTPIAQIIYVIIFILLATIGLLNNSLSLITFLQERIRITVSGVYLIIYCSCNIILMLLVYTNIFTVLHYNNNIYLEWHCFAFSYVCLTFDYIYIWMSVAIIIERLLIECLNFNIFQSRLRPIIISLIIICLVSLSNLPELFSRDITEDPFKQLICTYNTTKYHTWYYAQYIISYFHVIIPCIVYLISILCILTTISRRKIFINGCNSNSKTLQFYREWIKQLYNHREFFISPLIIIICILPHAIVHYILLSKCVRNNSLALIRLHIALVLLLNVPAMLAFIIYVYPNKLYLKEFQQTKIYRKFYCLLHCGKEINNKQRIRAGSDVTLRSIIENE